MSIKDTAIIKERGFIQNINAIVMKIGLLNGSIIFNIIGFNYVTRIIYMIIYLYIY